MKAVLALTVLCAVALAQDLECPDAIPGKFNYADFEGQWYEIGHYRNTGSSIWSDQCYCSTSNVTKDFLGEAEGDSVYSYVCNLEDANGEIQAFDTTLFGMDPPGEWYMEVVPGLEAQIFTAVVVQDGYALTYRCGNYGDLGISYTAQILSRKPVLDEATVKNMQAKVSSLGLNPEGAEYVQVTHDNCTYTGH